MKPVLRKKYRVGSLTLPDFNILQSYSGQNTVEGFLGGPVVKNLPYNAGGMGSIPCLGRSHIQQSN